MWNPSSQRLHGVEEDEAGRLKRFRKRFGRGFDAESAAATGNGDEENTGTQQDEDSFLDLISSYGQEETKAKGTKKEQAPAKSESK